MEEANLKAGKGLGPMKALDAPSTRPKHSSDGKQKENWRTESIANSKWFKETSMILFLVRRNNQRHCACMMVCEVSTFLTCVLSCVPVLPSPSSEQARCVR
jgi:hypothetical protein